MEENKNKSKSLMASKKLVISSFVVAISLVLIGVSLTYAYFTLMYRGQKTVGENSAAKLNISSTLENATAINEIQMNLISADEVEQKAKKVEFSVTNNGTSNIDAKYTVKLVDYSLTKNLSSEYFKWKLVVNGDEAGAITGNFFDESIAPEGTTSTEKISKTEKKLISDEEALPLTIGKTDDLVFYIWLENNPSANQLYLTNGSFSGRLSLEASPKEN